MPSSRATTWADQRLADNLVAGTPLVLNLLENAPTVDTLTAVRIVGEVYVGYTISVTVTDSLSRVEMGIGVSSVEAFAAGAGSLPSPAAETEYPPRGWLYVNSLAVWEKTDSAGIQIGPAHFKFDLRAMRKIDKGVLFMVMTNANITVGGSMQVVGRIRVLCLT